METNLIHINGVPVEIESYDYTILQQCELLGISIPRFCYHPQLSIAGNCRMCMVEVKNSVKPIIACATSVSKGLVVYTASDLVKIARENVIEFLLINHPLDCPICDQGGECDLQDQTMVYGSDRGRFKELKRSVEDKEFGPVIKTIMTRCIHCTRCVRYSEEIAGVNILGTMGRGKDTEISTYVLNYYSSEVTGNIVDICPVGALTSKPYAFRARPWELVSIESIDVFDSMCSNIRVDVKGNEVMRILPVRNSALNVGWITDKVRFSYQGMKVDRGFFPMHFVEGKHFVISWDKAFSLFRSKLFEVSAETIQVNIGDFLSLQDLNLINYFYSKIGVNNINYVATNVNIDLRNNWLLNQDIDSFLSSDVLVFINTNLKYQNSVLNSLIVKEKFNRDVGLNVLYIGGHTEINYGYTHIGISSISVLNHLQGRSSWFGNSYLEDKITYCLSENSNSFDFSIRNASKYNNNIITSYIADKPSHLNSFELGLSNNSLNTISDVSTVNITHSVGKLLDLNANGYKVLQHYFIGVNLPDLYLPIVSPLEDTGMFINFLFNFQYTGKVIDKPGSALTNTQVFNSLLPELDLADNMSSDLLDIYSKYALNSSSYYSSKIFKNINSNVINNVGIHKAISADAYYLSDEISMRSKTLYSSYLLTTSWR